MAMGMSYSEFWDGEPSLVRVYKKAYEYRKEAENEMLWLGGMYTASAVASVLLGRKAPYPEKQFPLDTSISRARKQHEQELNELKAIDYFNTWAEQWNQKFFSNKKTEEPANQDKSKQDDRKEGA